MNTLIHYESKNTEKYIYDNIGNYKLKGLYTHKEYGTKKIGTNSE